jgi:hypothetical protein
METEERNTTLQDVTLAVLRQHAQLVQMMDELESLASGVLEGKECAPALKDAIVTFHERFVRYLDFDESRLMPLIGAMRAEVASSLRATCSEHPDLRDRIDGLMHDRTVFTDARTLAHEAITFVHLVRADLAEEDSALHALG